jgi:hypothetical protein
VRAGCRRGEPAAIRPFRAWAPRFFEHLREERGLSATTIDGYALQLARFEQYVAARGLTADALSPAILDGFLAERRVDVCARCSALRAQRSVHFFAACSGLGSSVAISVSSSTGRGLTVSRRSLVQSPRGTSSARWQSSSVVRSSAAGTTPCSCYSSFMASAHARSPR